MPASPLGRRAHRIGPAGDGRNRKLQAAMDGITRYILRQLIFGMLLVTVGLTCVIWLSQSLRFIEMIVNRGLSAGQFFYLTFLLLPNFLSIILPIALFTIVVFTYNKLISDRELVVMRAAGLSQMALARPTLILSLAVVAFECVLNAYLLPESYRLFRDLQWDVRYNYTHLVLQEGAFNTVSQDITVYVRERSADGQLQGILVHDSRNANKPQTWMAARGGLIDTENGPRVIMFDGSVQEVDRATHQHSILYFDRSTMDLGAARQVSEARYREPRERSIAELFAIEQDKFLNPNDIGKFRVEGHRRLIMPLIALSFPLIGLACLICGHITRHGQGTRIGAAVGLIVLFQASAMGLENLCARIPELIPLMYANAVLPLFLAFALLLTHPHRRRPAPVAAAVS